MKIIEKRDVKNHLSLRHSRDIHLCEPVSQRDTTGCSVDEADVTGASASAFTGDYFAEHTIAVVPAAQTVNSTVPRDVQRPDATKSAQA
jgi:hypothetical protein